MTQVKPTLVAWFDVKDVNEVEKINGFVPAYIYASFGRLNPHEWGIVEQDNLIIRYRATGAIKRVTELFGEFG